MSKFIQPNFIFDRYPAEIHLLTLYVILGIFIFFFLVGLLFAILASKKEGDKIMAKFFAKTANWGLWSGVIGLFITFLRYERAPYIGMRFWTLAWLIFNIIWLFFVLKYLIKDVPKLKAEREKRKEFEKYLP